MTSQSEIFIYMFETTNRTLKLQVSGLTHEESLLQPPFQGNCLNWVLGHIITSRGDILRLLDENHFWDDTMIALYDRGSAGITPANSDQALRLETLLADLDQSLALLKTALAKKTPADWDTVIRERTLLTRMAFLQFHESYHTGQTELLRQLAGKNDVVIP